MHLFYTRRRRFTADTNGFTLLLAALVAAIVLALASSIFTIAQKQLVLSSIGRDSQFSFYAADSAAECALYYDFRFQLFPSTTPITQLRGNAIVCDGAPADIIDISGGSIISTEFQTEIRTANTPAQLLCALVQVNKNTVTGTSTIRADGYNVSCGDKDESPRSLQRSVELRY